MDSYSNPNVPQTAAALTAYPPPSYSNPNVPQIAAALTAYPPPSSGH